MMLTAILLAMVAMASAQPPQPCCLPMEYTMTMTDLKEYGTVQWVFSEMSVDVSNKKMGQKFFSQTSTGPQMTRRQVMDFTAKKIYIIQPDGSCAVYPYVVPFFGNCIPKDATYLGSSYVGHSATPDTQYDGWLFQLDQANVSIAVDKHCVPIAEKVHGKIGQYPTDVIYFFNGYREGIADPSIFDIPASCNQ